MTGNGGKKWPVGHTPAVHSSQLSLCAYELQKWATMALQPDVTLTLCPLLLGATPLRWTRSDPALHKLPRPWSFSRKNYLYSTQSETQGMWKQNIGGTHCVLAHKSRFFCTRVSESGCSSAAVTLEGSTARHSCLSGKTAKVGNLHSKCRFPISPNLPEIILDFFPCPQLFLLWAPQAGGKTGENLEVGTAERKLGNWDRKKEKINSGSKKLLDGWSGARGCDKKQRSHRTPSPYQEGREMEKGVLGHC